MRKQAPKTRKIAITNIGITLTSSQDSFSSELLDDGDESKMATKQSVPQGVTKVLLHRYFGTDPATSLAPGYERWFDEASELSVIANQDRESQIPSEDYEFNPGLDL